MLKMQGVISADFVSADSRGVKERGLVTAESKAVEVPLESADARGSRKC